jgi:hypothetical protein
LFTADAGPTSGIFTAPTEVFDYNPVTNTITQVSSPDPILPLEPSFPDRMLELPTGQILFEDGGPQLYVYTPDGSAPLLSRPFVTSVTASHGVYTLTGVQLNGQSAGATYGDDAEMDSNYPIVSLTNPITGQVFYARTFNWSNTGVQTGLFNPETVNFTLPAGMPGGIYLLTDSGAGIQSLPFVVFIGPGNGGGQNSFAATIGGAPNSAMVGVSMALTHTGVVSHGAALSNSAAKVDAGAAGAASFGLAGGAVLQDSAAAMLAAQQVKSTGAGTDALDALFADYFVNPF